MALLVVHGVLHVLGMDHDSAPEAEAMEKREQELLDKFHRKSGAGDGSRGDDVG